MTTRKYSSRSQQTTLTSAVTSGATVIPVANATTLLGGATISTGQTFTVVIDPDTALEEIVDITVVSGNNLTVTRDVDMAGAAAQDHSAGAVNRHMIIGRDLREANLHIEATGGYNDGTGAHLLHGVSATSAVVGTYETQTLYNKTLVAPTLTSTLENDTGITFEGSTADAFETFLTVVDPTQDNTITLPNTSGTIDIIDAAQTLTNKTITSPTINGTPVITGLSSTGMSTTSATPKNYVDSILGSATAASTSAASAAVSATSSATSASAALTSANSAATSATAAAASATTATTQATAATTSATSAAASATAAATSAVSAATSASAAATSATSAAASATTAAASVASIATYASNALASQNAASTSATSAAASATAAATSATSAAASASSMTASVAAAATSATSAAASATAAATSATSAAASATSASGSATTASASAASATTSASSALTSQTAAATSATSAAASATAAATSASSAATSATSSATSASSSLATYNTYKTYYLGSFASAPTLDNQGNALITGATYFNSTTNVMYVYSGSTWNAISSATSYSAPTLGSTTINSGTTYSTVTGLNLTTSTVTADPTTALGIASKQYVDAVTAAINFHAPVKLATTSNLSVTYSNGTSGVGATLTATGNGRGQIDSVNITTGDRILVKNQTTDLQNGIYTVTNQGGAGNAYILTRATDYDTTTEVTNGDVIFTTAGTVNTGVTFVNTSTGSVTIGTTSIIFSVYTSASLPTQTGFSGYLLTTDGTTPSWTNSVTNLTLVTPSIGVATGTSFNSITGLSSTTPNANGTAAVGTGTTTARADHVHPTTGLGLTTSGLNQFAATTSAQLAGVISDETGSGALVFATSPTLITPVLGTATATKITTPIHASLDANSYEQDITLMTIMGAWL